MCFCFWRVIFGLRDLLCTEFVPNDPRVVRPSPVDAGQRDEFDKLVDTAHYNDNVFYDKNSLSYYRSEFKVIYCQG